MAYYDTNNQDEQIGAVLRYLFEYQPAQRKRLQLEAVRGVLAQLELGASYQLFALVAERLPSRAKLFFAAEDFQGKNQMILEVIMHLAEQEMPAA